MALNLFDIVRLNNEAVCSLVLGDLDAAHDKLEIALGDFYSGLDQEQDSPLHQASSVGAESGAESIRGVSIHPKFSSADYAFSPENNFKIYDCAFVLPTSRHSQANRDDCAVTILYNFGLVLQRRAILKGKQSLLRKATKIYNMTTALLLDEGLANRSNTPGLALLHLATWANQGFIYSYKLQHDLAMVCAEYIQDLSQSSSLSSVDWVFFRRIVVRMQVFGLPKHWAPAA